MERRREASLNCLVSVLVRLALNPRYLVVRSKVHENRWTSWPTWASSFFGSFRHRILPVRVLFLKILHDFVLTRTNDSLDLSLYE